MEGRSADHPRSRGVYRKSGVGYELVRGSSPLARGLPGRSESGGACGRIIPARAGFTRRQAPNPRAGGDHPRSRGVYLRPPTGCWRRPGSSPLARGLRQESGMRPTSEGIIPARAGFTRRPRGRRPRPRDHPRSRGVYRRVRCSVAWAAGSSPLARGLRPPGAGGVDGDRIIPARAGFTMLICGHWPTSGDHPRSRGVYASGGAHRMVTAGSSPLARGLRGR